MPKFHVQIMILEALVLEPFNMVQGGVELQNQFKFTNAENSKFVNKKITDW